MQKAIALTAFVHGSLNLKRGETAEFSVGAFEDLKKAGLVTAAAAPLAGEPAASQTAPVQKSASPRAPRAPRAPSDKNAPPLDSKNGAGSSSDAANLNAGADTSSVDCAADSASLAKAEGDASNAADSADAKLTSDTATASPDAAANT